LRPSGRFIRSANRLRDDTKAATVEARVFAFFGFGLALGIPDASSSWPLLVATTVAVLSLACTAPFIWYAAWVTITFLGLAPSRAQISERNYSQCCVRCRTQCRLAAARLDASIARVEASAHAASAGGSVMTIRRASEAVEHAVLSDYANDCEAWILDVLKEAWQLGASVPGSVRSPLAARTVGDLRVLSVVLREVEDELGRIAVE
jgi:hypothetical protein